jgi:MFS family permease
VLATPLTSSRALIGALVGSEGFVALLLPVWIGAASDRVRSPLGRRLPFLAVTAPVAALALFALPFGKNMGVLALFTLVFYLAYFAYYAPYRALYSDVVPVEESGRAQGIQGVFRGAGLGLALVGGSVLLPLWRGLPFAIGAGGLVATTSVPFFFRRRVPLRKDVPAASGSLREEVWHLLVDHGDIRRFMAANLLWQLTEGGLKSFVVLYLTRGLDKPFAFGAAAMGVVAVAALVAAPIAGKLADRFGPVRVMRITTAIFGIGLWVPAFSKSTALLLAVLPVVGMGGAMALSLPYAILMTMMPKGSHGAAAGLFDVSGGAGALLGPIVTGAMIDALMPLFRSTHGYAAMWPTIGTAALLSLFLVRRRDDRSRASAAPPASPPIRREPRVPCA